MSAYSSSFMFTDPSSRVCIYSSVHIGVTGIHIELCVCGLRITKACIVGQPVLGSDLGCVDYRELELKIYFFDSGAVQLVFFIFGPCRLVIHICTWVTWGSGFPTFRAPDAPACQYFSGAKPPKHQNCTSFKLNIWSACTLEPPKP